MKRTVLFYRDFRRFHGGHLKVFDYFNHVLASDGFTPRISFGPRTSWDESNPWIGSERYFADEWEQAPADVFFVGGRGWEMVDEHPAASPETPVLNLVAGIRHADPNSNRFEFLGRRAIRICASEPVADAIGSTGLVRGPVLVIPNGIDVEGLKTLDVVSRDVDVLVAAMKNPELGAELAEALVRRGHGVELLRERLPRVEYLDRVRRSRVAVFLPLEEEGFYLPPLEAMALGTLVVCPDCIGNRSFCIADETCLVPEYTESGLSAACEAALALRPSVAARLLAGARLTAEGHSLATERRAFLHVLDRLDDLWAQGA